MTRAELCALAWDAAPRALREEIEHFRDNVDREDDGVPYDTISALWDAEQAAEDFGNRRIITACRRVFIALGCYRVMTPEEISETWVSRGTAWAFALDGKKWTDADDCPAPQFVTE